MAARLPERKRAAIRAAVEARDGRSRAQIARDLGTSPRTVQRIAEDAGLTGLWDTTGTRAATAAARDHLRARRAALSARFLDEVEWLLGKLHAPYVVHAFAGKDGDFNSATLAEPDAGALRNLATSAAVMFDKHLAADKHDAGDDTDDAVSMLGRLAEGLDAAHRALTGAHPGSDALPDDEPGEPPDDGPEHS